MKRANFQLNREASIFAIVAAAFPVVGYAAPPARVDFAVGNVTAVGPGGQQRTLVKGVQVEEGETVNTNDGRVQLRFTDGAYVSLQPKSEFRIDQYRFEGKQDGSEKGLFSLLKGGLRTVTGLVGRTNKKNYQVTTTVATIGIRGTEYTIQYGQSITGTVGDGEIQVCNGAGCLNVTSGESYYVEGHGFKPVLSNKKADLPAPPPQIPPVAYEQQSQSGASGLPSLGLALVGTLNLDFVQVGFGISDCTPFTCGSNSGVIVFDSNGKLVNFNGQPASNAQAGGNDGIIAWGTFDSTPIFGTGTTINHYVAGLPVPAADLTALGGTTGNYTLIGATPVTNSANQQIGTLNSATLIVNFGAAGPVSAGMSWTINNLPVSASLTGTYFGNSKFSLSGSATCGTSCSVSANVALFGPNAVRAGMAYSMSAFTSNFNAIGAVALTKK